MAEPLWRRELDELLRDLQENHLSDSPEQREKLSRLQKEVKKFENQEQEKVAKNKG